MGNWYIVQTNPNCERKAAREMRRHGFGVHIPRVGVIRIHHRTGKKIMKRRIAMAGYVFLRFKGPANWYALRQCQGVKGVLYIDGSPYAMPEPDVLAIIRAQRTMAYEDQDTRDARKEMRRESRKGNRIEVAVAVRSVNRRRFAAGMQITAPMSGSERVLARILSVTKKGTIKAVVITGHGDDRRETPVEFTDVDNLELVDSDREAA